jgi:tetratricopeptide (TPR) repeat protein
MSEKRIESAADAKTETIKPIPENLPEELLPLYDWWKEKGARSLVTAGAIALVALGALAFVHYRRGRVVEANLQLTRANSVEELEAAVAQFGSLNAGNAARLRLAKAYYDAAKYAEALAAYEESETRVPAEFRDIAVLGRAHSLEALERTDEALQVYRKFTDGSRQSYLYPQAVMGLARVLTLKGQKEDARRLLEELKAEKSDQPMWEMTIANLEDIIDRYEPRARRSLFDMAEAAEKSIEQAAPSAPAAQE